MRGMVVGLRSRRLMQRAIVVRFLTAATAVLVVGGLAWLAWSWQESRLPGTYDVMDYGSADYGGGPLPKGTGDHARHGDGHAISVAELTGPRGAPDARFTLTARRARLRLPSGKTIETLTFGGRAPGPELRVRQGDLVAVTLRNDDVDVGVSIHWHGVDVPNAEDGVAGVTQDAVMPGGRYDYRFRAEQVGTFWYHTHQASAKEVKRGLFGAFVIEPRRAARDTLDLALAAHDFAGVETVNGVAGMQRRAVAPGTRVRLRLINTDSTPQRFTLIGTPFRVLAIDGTDLNAPSPLAATALELGAGGRYDLGFTMPETPVELTLPDTRAGLVLSRDGRAEPAVEPAAEPAGENFDPAVYGRPASTPFGRSSRFDRRFRFEIGRKPGFLDGRPGFHWTINGRIFPDVPVFVVEKGDLVKITFVNSTDAVHPMHLHGHHMLVLSRDGAPVSGSPWWSDTLPVEPGERYEVAFRADNPGLWMDHCHNLRHAAEGLTMHVAYAGVETPFRAGGAAHNHPE